MESEQVFEPEFEPDFEPEIQEILGENEIFEESVVEEPVVEEPVVEEPVIEEAVVEEPEVDPVVEFNSLFQKTNEEPSIENDYLEITGEITSDIEPEAPKPSQPVQPVQPVQQKENTLLDNIRRMLSMYPNQPRKPTRKVNMSFHM